MTTVATYHLKRECGNIRPFCRPCTNSFKVTTCGPIDCDEPPPSLICLKPVFGPEKMFVGGSIYAYNERIVWNLSLDGGIDELYPRLPPNFSLGSAVGAIDTDRAGNVYFILINPPWGFSYDSIFSLTPNGVLRWAVPFKAGVIERPTCLAVSNDGYVYVGSSALDPSIKKFNKDTGAEITTGWPYVYDGVDSVWHATVRRLVCDQSGNVYATGTKNTSGSNTHDGYNIWSITPDGVERWRTLIQRAFSGSTLVDADLYGMTLNLDNSIISVVTWEGYVHSADPSTGVFGAGSFNYVSQHGGGLYYDPSGNLWAWGAAGVSKNGAVFYIPGTQSQAAVFDIYVTRIDGSVFVLRSRNASGVDATFQIVKLDSAGAVLDYISLPRDSSSTQVFARCIVGNQGRIGAFGLLSSP